jgi:hypothetical protein
MPALHVRCVGPWQLGITRGPFIQKPDFYSKIGGLMLLLLSASKSPNLGHGVFRGYYLLPARVARRGWGGGAPIFHNVHADVCSKIALIKPSPGPICYRMNFLWGGGEKAWQEWGGGQYMIWQGVKLLNLIVICEPVLVSARFIVLYIIKHSPLQACETLG